MSLFFKLCFLSILLTIPSLPSCLSQSSEPAPAPAPEANICNGVLLSYIHLRGGQIPPINPSHQAYRFESMLTILNNGVDKVLSWRVFVGFQHEELLVSASNAVLADGSSLPVDVSNGTVFAGYPNADLDTAIQTAGDVKQMQVQIRLVGTQFGVKPPDVPMPKNISLANDGWECPKPTLQGKSVMQVCCTKDPKFVVSNITESEEFLPRQNGDLTIMYDVIRTYDSNYWAQVSIANHNPLGRLDNWKLSWDWMRDEFIYTMKGAYPYVVDSSGCVFGSQSTYYADLDFSTVLNCEKRPTIIDLPPTKANDTNLGMIPNCCRNGSILPPSMDSTKAVSVFQMQVYKMPPDLNRSELTPPQNWRINGSLNPNYQCGPPVRVSPSQFIDPSGLSNTTAFASWQVVCNITRRSTPKCCVSFSAYYNDSVVPCNTCACGCPSNTGSMCSTSSPAILLPSNALLVPFENRTALALAWSEINHRTVPNPVPCGDNCGVSINWHLYTDYTRGWTARITVFNWDETSYPDWFAAVEMDKAAPGFEKTYSFNGSVLSGVNNTIFMTGLPGLNYLVAEADGAKPTDPRVPGKQQSVISFTKKATPGIDVPRGGGFPSKVFFNGEECSLPSVYPTSSSSRIRPSLLFSFFLAGLLLKLMS